MMSDSSSMFTYVFHCLATGTLLEGPLGPSSGLQQPFPFPLPPPPDGFLAAWALEGSLVFLGEELSCFLAMCLSGVLKLKDRPRAEALVYLQTIQQAPTAKVPNCSIAEPEVSLTTGNRQGLRTLHHVLQLTTI